MATSFLRKIILEEIKKVLKEENKPPLPGEMDFMGPSNGVPQGKTIDFSDEEGTKIKTGVGPCGPGFNERCKPKVLKFQRLLNAVAKKSGGQVPRIKEDGLLGNQTLKLASAVAGHPLNKGNLQYDVLFPVLKDMAASTTPKEIQRIVSAYRGESGASASEKTVPEAVPGTIEKKDTFVPDLSSGVTPETREAERKAAEEKREAEKQVYPQVPKNESLIMKEIAKLLKNI